LKIGTRKFGEIQIDETKILVMPEGLPGFSGYEKFVLLEDPKTAPFCWFQAVDEPNLSLIVMDPLAFKSDYSIDTEAFIKTRGWEETRPEDLLVYVVVNVSEKTGETRVTANLIGPLLINPNNNEVVQVVISDSSYSHQHNVLEPS
jgi:flagellar assembly factor FliW